MDYIFVNGANPFVIGGVVPENCAYKALSICALDVAVVQRPRPGTNLARTFVTRAPAVGRSKPVRLMSRLRSAHPQLQVPGMSRRDSTQSGGPHRLSRPCLP